MSTMNSSTSYGHSFRLAQDYPNACHLHLAVPYMSPHWSVYEAAIQAVRDGLCDNYGSQYGIQALRIAIAEKLHNYNRYEVTWDNVIVTTGAQEAFALAMTYLLQPGDVVIMSCPTYPGHISTASMMGARILFAHKGERGALRLSRSDLDDLWLQSISLYDRTPKVFVICDPVNPTGDCLSQQECETLAEFALDKGLWIVADETYEYFQYQGAHYSLGAIEEIRPYLIGCFSMSKTYSIPGWRVGYAVSDLSVVDDLISIHDNLVINASVVAQYAALAAISLPDQMRDEARHLMRAGRDVLVAGLNSTTTFSAGLPQGGLSILAKLLVPWDSDELVDELARNAGVIAMSGKAFGPRNLQQVRFCFGQPLSVLTDSVERILSWEKSISSSTNLHS